MNGKFEIFEGKNGQYYFRFILNNGQKILRSEGYSSLSAAKNGVEAVKQASKNVESYSRLKSRNDKYYFNLKAKNGQIVGTSKPYPSKTGREGAIYAVSNFANTAKVSELESNYN